MTVLSVIKGDNAHLISEAAKLWIKEDDQVLDLTYGRGLFWSDYRPSRLVTNDLYTDADFHFDYRGLPSALTDAYDVVVFDPPYISTGSRVTSTLQREAMGDVSPDFYDRYGIGTRKGYAAVFADIGLGIEQAAKVLRPGGHLMVKTCDFVESGQRRWGRRHVEDVSEASDLVKVDEFVHWSGTGPQPLTNIDGSPRRQVHSRRAHSFLLVFRKARR